MAKPRADRSLLSNFQGMWEASGLKEKILFTLAMIAFFRLGALIPIQGIDATVIQHTLQSNQSAQQLVGLLDMFSGGALTSVSILALGIGPYITSSIIMQLLTVVIPRLEELQKEEGEAGRRAISKYTRYLAVGLAVFQSLLITNLLAHIPGAVTIQPLWLFYPLAVISLTAGAIFSLWVAEMISVRGIGNGGSLLIFFGIVSRIPFYVSQTAIYVGQDGQKAFALLCLLAIYVLTIGFIIILQESVRKIFIVSARRQVGNKMYGGQNTYIPFKINPAGVMPIIFAFAVLTFPTMLMGFLRQYALSASMDANLKPVLLETIRWYELYLAPGSVGYIIVEFSLIVAFSFFCISIYPSMQPREIAENLKKYGSSIPGIKPGKPTADKLDEILSRTTLIGAVMLGLITLIATAATTITGITALQGLGSTSLIIMVGVALDTMNQIRVHLLSRQYEGFLKG